MSLRIAIHHFKLLSITDFKGLKLLRTRQPVLRVPVRSVLRGKAHILQNITVDVGKECDFTIFHKDFPLYCNGQRHMAGCGAHLLPGAGAR